MKKAAAQEEESSEDSEDDKKIKKVNGGAETSSEEESDSEEEEEVRTHTAALSFPLSLSLCRSPRWTSLRTGNASRLVRLPLESLPVRRTRTSLVGVAWGGVAYSGVTPLHSAGTLFVGNLSFDVDEDLLREFVTSQGHTPSAVRIITNQEGRSKG